MPKVNWAELYYHAKRSSEELKTREGFSDGIQHLDAFTNTIEKDINSALNNHSNVTKNEIKHKRAKSNFNPKPCKNCGKIFQPTGSRHLWCENCETPSDQRQKLIAELMKDNTKGGYNA
jgi:tRNA(Ile2) C34 agmatinyltransferase TiaS